MSYSTETITETLWDDPPRDLTLGGNEVHVWRASLNQAQLVVDALRETLSQDERERAQRFRFKIHQDHYIVARGFLRAILACYLRESPSHLQFSYGSHGKPSLAERFSHTNIKFNLSHSNELVLYAVTLSREVGVDIEFIKSDFAASEIAERFFSPREVAAFRSLPLEARSEAFFNCWTRKEAYIKATGEGVSFGLDNFDVSLIPGEPAALLKVLRDEQEHSRWKLEDLKPGEGYKAAVIAEGSDWELKCWQWQPK